ncbi:MAG: sulfurtransferase-like selenium metabolism protein YedF [Pseudomonadota bacterium]
MIHKLNVKGKPCPTPLIETKTLYEKININEEIIVTLDNEISKNNVKRYINSVGGELKEEKENDLYVLKIKKIACEVCKPLSIQEKNTVIYVASSTMGIGDDDLGAILLKGFINTIKSLETLPRKIIFVNKGVLMSLKDSPVLESLQELEKNGVEILACGTCLEYFKQKDNLGVGIISNMYDILSALDRASNVIRP